MVGCVCRRVWVGAGTFRPERIESVAARYGVDGKPVLVHPPLNASSRSRKMGHAQSLVIGIRLSQNQFVDARNMNYRTTTVSRRLSMVKSEDLCDLFRRITLQAYVYSYVQQNRDYSISWSAIAISHVHSK
jgi:hypothetical protein